MHWHPTDELEVLQNMRFGLYYWAHFKYISKNLLIKDNIEVRIQDAHNSIEISQI